MQVVKANNFKEGTDGYMLHVNEEELLLVTAMLGWSGGQSDLVTKYASSWWNNVKKITGFDILKCPFAGGVAPATNPNWKAPNLISQGNNNGNI